jgi:uncharacterized lipoprotein YddW (UPF0748 family)
MVRGWIAAALLLAGPVARSADAPPEFRAAWADGFHDGYRSAAQVTAMIDTLAAANYNALVLEVRKCGDAYYDSAYEPRASNILDPPPFDPLADAIAKGHAKGIEIHAWIVTYRIWSSAWAPPPSDHVWSLHPEWALEDANGGILDGSYYDLDPGVPGVQDYVCRIAVDVVSKYDVDGFNFDYIRYPSGYTWGYNDIARQRFFDEEGYWPPTSTADPHWEAWAAYRRRQVTDLVKKCALEIWWRKPWVKVSVDTIGWMGANPNTDYTATRQYKEVLQDSRGWVEQHLVDMNILMNYKREYDAAQRNDYRLWTDFISSEAFLHGRHAVDGQAAYLNAIADSVTQMTYARSALCAGGATYSYAVTNKDGQPASAFFDAVRNALYQAKAPVPEMPWKSAPTTGALFGTVLATARPADPIYGAWVYRATVSAEGPVTRTTQSDATGTYGFLDLPPGEYTVTASRAGLPLETFAGVDVAPGLVTRRDFDLSDRDGDGHVASADCNDADGAAWSPPGEARDLAIAADRVRFSWQPPADPGGAAAALVYDLLRAAAPDRFTEDECAATAVAATFADDAVTPATGAAAFYLVRPKNGCAGAGTLGRRSDGTEREGRGCP